MANAQAFESGYQQGYNVLEQKRAHKQALSDEEHELKVNDLMNRRDAIVKKLPSLEGPDKDAALKDLQSIAQGIRVLYHHEHAPGRIEKFGHLVTDRLGLTNPNMRTMKSDRKWVDQNSADQNTAQGWAEAAPLSPEQTAQSDIAIQNAKANAQIQWLKDHDASPEVIQSATSALGGAPITKGTKVVGQPYQDANDKKWYQRYLNNDGTDYRVEVPGYTPKESGAGPIRAWTKDNSGRVFSVLLDRQTNKPVPGSENYDILPPPYLTERVSTGVYHWTDENNQVHETPETRTTKPVLPSSSDGSTPSSEPAAPSINDVKKGASARAPKSPMAGPTRQAIKDKILGYKSSAPLNHAKTVLADSVRIASIGDKLLARAQQNPNDMSEADTQFVLSLIRSEAGRVNQQEIQQLFTAGGIAEAPERWASNAGYGQLAPDLRRQLVEFTHDMRDASVEAVNSLSHNPNNSQGVGTTKMQAPDGTVQDVPSDQVEHYKSLGAKVVQ